MARKFATDAEPDTPLLWVLRDHLGMTGSKFGCGKALCGACTVHIDGNATRSCVLPVSAVASSKITTIEGVDQSKIGKAVQDAWIAEDVPQCGYCQSGQIMSATALLTTNQKPTDADIDAAMSGNVCRCAPPMCASVRRSSAPPARWPEENDHEHSRKRGFDSSHPS